MNGTLYIIATPIGNLEDITERSIRILKQIDLILAEDTRITGSLLSKLNISAKIESYHKFSEKKQLAKYVHILQNGLSIGLVSDAGTPAVSDPGKFLVKACLENNITVSPIPGATAAMAGFCASGVLSDQFIFGGFLPSKGAVREHTLQSLLEHNMPLILYESPHRIQSLLNLINTDSYRVIICRELTKLYEEIFEYTGQRITEKGEFTIVIEPLKQQYKEQAINNDLLEILMQSNLSDKDILKVLQELYPEQKRNKLKSIILGTRMQQKT